MATTNLGGTLPTVNASSDTWGTENNTFLTIVDKYFAMFAADNIGTPQNVSSGVAAYVTFGNEVLDTAGGFASSTHTVPVGYAGKWEYKANVSGAGTSGSLIRVEVQFWKNGALYRTVSTNGLEGTGSTGSKEGEVIVTMAEGDTMAVKGIVTASGTVTFDGTAPSFCSFSGRFLHT